MLIKFDDRPSDSPYVERVWRSRSERAGPFLSIATCHWEMVVTKLAGRAFLTVRGPETFASMAACPPDGEWVAIRFKLGTFLNVMRPGMLRDNNAVTLPTVSRRFLLNGSAWEFPEFENAETFVRQLVRDGLVGIDPAVSEAVSGEPSAQSLRTLQRRVLHATGMTHATIRQIDRARQATQFLKRGMPVVEAACRAGYYDQAHMTRSLKQLVGLTPGEIARDEMQLSFLYNTSPEQNLTV